MTNEPKHTPTATETIDEAAKNYANYNEPTHLAIKESVKFGAKWQSEQNQSQLESLRAANAELVDALRDIVEANESEHLDLTQTVDLIIRIASTTLAKHDRP